jgi:hypothetical protein
MTFLTFIFWLVLAIVVIFIPPLLWGDATLDTEQDGYVTRVKSWFCLLACLFCIGLAAISLNDLVILAFFGV